MYQIALNSRKGEWKVQISAFIPVTVLDKMVRYGIPRSETVRKSLINAVREYEHEHGIVDPDNAGVA